MHATSQRHRVGVNGALVALGPCEGAIRVPNGPAWLDTGVVLQLDAPLNPGQATSLRIEITSRASGGLLWFRVMERRSVEHAILVMLVWCRGFSLREARSLGMRPHGTARLLETRIVDGDAPFDDALELRLLGNQAFGRLKDVRDPRTLADDLDPFAVNVVCRLGDKAVGTGRVVVNGGDRSRSECEREAGLPDWLWTAGFVEVSRFAVCPGYRSGGILIELFREVGRISLRLQARYMVLDCIDKLIPLYRRVGAEPLGLSKKHPYSTERVTLMFVDVEKSMTRFGRNLLFWLIVFGPVLDDMSHRNGLAFYEQHMKRTDKVFYRVKTLLSKAVSFALRLTGQYRRVTSTGLGVPDDRRDRL
ncbi:MAG: hypothetical protein ABSC94_25805 [Polyangiaceae bacterium]